MTYYKYFFIIAINFWIIAGLAKAFESKEFNLFADIAVLVLFFSIGIFLIEAYFFGRKRK